MDGVGRGIPFPSGASWESLQSIRKIEGSRQLISSGSPAIKGFLTIPLIMGLPPHLFSLDASLFGVWWREHRDQPRGAYL